MFTSLNFYSGFVKTLKSSIVKSSLSIIAIKKLKGMYLYIIGYRRVNMFLYNIDFIYVTMIQDS